MQRMMETPRIYLRKMTMDDWNDLKVMLQDIRVMYAYEHAFSDEEVLQWLQQQQHRYESYGNGLLLIVDKVTEQVVG